jgi:6,7-dimethyl-8-ribityllumazine synthase
MTEINYQSKPASPFPIAIVVSRFNEPVTSKLLNSALARLETCGFGQELISVVHVPGAVEIPLICQSLLEKRPELQAVVTLGAVIRGETSHYDYVCEQVSQGCQQIALTKGVPIIFGVLTTENAEQAFARAGGTHSDKGVESIDAAMEMVQVLQAINSL